MDFGGGSEKAARASSCCSGCRIGVGCSSQGGHHHHDDEDTEIQRKLAHNIDRGVLALAMRDKATRRDPVVERSGASRLSDLKLPPVMWLGLVCATASNGYFESALDWEGDYLTLEI